MVTIKKTASILGALIVTVAVGSLAEARQDIYRHIDQLAVKIERKAKVFKNSIRRYRHTPEYEHLINDAVEMCRLADHVHEVAHREGNLAHLEADLRDLDKTYHHIERLLERIEHDAAYGAGHVHGNTRFVWTVMKDLEECIHHIRDDLRQLRAMMTRNRRGRDHHYGNSGFRHGYGGDFHGNRRGADFGRHGTNWHNGYGGYGHSNGFEARFGRNLSIDSHGRGGITLGSGGLQFRIGF